jgi:hypothetical protein
MTTRRRGLGGLLTALVLALAVVVPAGAAQAAASPQRTVAAPIHAQKAHPSARVHVHTSSPTKLVHDLDASTPPSHDVPAEPAAIAVEQHHHTGLVGIATATALGRGPPVL